MHLSPLARLNDTVEFGLYLMGVIYKINESVSNIVAIPVSYIWKAGQLIYAEMVHNGPCNIDDLAPLAQDCTRGTRMFVEHNNPDHYEYKNR